MTIRELRGSLDNFTIGLCGDLKFGRTVHSLINSLIRYKNVKFILISPKELRVPDYIIDTLKENKSEEVLEVKEVKEKTLLDDYDIQEIETPKNHKTSIKKETNTKYEKISLEDILKDDSF